MNAKVRSIDSFREALFSAQWRPVLVIGSTLAPITAETALIAAHQSATDGRPIYVTTDSKRALLILESDWDGRPESEALK
jgi:hypothetical protein